MFDYTNTNQVSIGGEYLNDSIYVQVRNLNFPMEVAGFTVQFHVLTGGGSVDQQQVKTRKDGKAATRWKLGTESFIQLASAKICGPDGKFLPEARFLAHGVLYNAWNEVDYQPLSMLYDLATDTVAHISLMVSWGGVYKRGADFLDWILVPDKKLSGAIDIEIDKKGVVYVGTSNGELFKSTDHGVNWNKCTNPIPNRSNHFYFRISDDGDLWATVSGQDVWHSGDGGLSWSNQDKGVAINSLLFGAFRLKSGLLISFSEVGHSVMKSEDNGKTWSIIESPPNATYCYVTENEDIIVFTHYGMLGFYKSSDLGKSFKQVNNIPTGSAIFFFLSHIQNQGKYYYVLAPEFGVLKTQNFDEFETFLAEPNVGGLFVDHTGSIVASGTRDKWNRTFYFNRK
ncbi:MAG TPA: hypothetical protein DCR40_02095 [Prolixibacteraceae bacterium]|nr:hypothetical protein [Prolixibacteraceae bacterium]